MSFSVRSEDVRLMLWDTAGQEEFDAITKAYYRGKLFVRYRCVCLYLTVAEIKLYNAI